MHDRSNPEAAIAEAVAKYSNWGRWGPDDVLGTVNFIDEAKRREGAALVRTGVTFSLSQRFDANGPQKGWRNRNNPVHVMLGTGLDAVHREPHFPHGIAGADDMIIMPLQCSTQWDGLGHIFDHGKAWNGRPADKVVTTDGDQVTGIEHLAAPVGKPLGALWAFVLVEEPQAGRDLRRPEQLRRQGNHAGHEVGLDHGCPDLPFTGLL